MAKEDSVRKGQPNGYAPLDGSGLVPVAHIPEPEDMGAAPACEFSLGGSSWTNSGNISGAPTTTMATWQAVTNGTFNVDIDGTTHSVTGCNFSGCSTLDDVAAVIQAAIRAVTGSNETYFYDAGGYFVLVSMKTDITGSTGFTSAQGTGTDISGAGATAFMAGTLARGATSFPVTYTFTTGDQDRVFGSTGSTRELLYILPPAVAGMRVHLINDDPNPVNSIVYLQAAAGDAIQAGAVASSTYRIIASVTKGDAVILVAINSDQWVAESVVGSWTGL